MPITLLQHAERHGDRTAVFDSQGVFTYRDLLRRSVQAATTLLDGADDLGEARVAFLIPPGFQYVRWQWGVWRAGGVAVPLCPAHPPPEWEYVIDDAEASIVVAHAGAPDALRELAAARGLRFIDADAAADHEPQIKDQAEPNRRAMILYTSGTTDRPKGVVSTHANIQAQVETLINAWEWSENDRILNVLPLHHVHGIINVLTCALWAGAACELPPRFSPPDVWRRLSSGELTLFMAVPTIYARLIEHWRSCSPADQQRLSSACGSLRLMVSGSAALPESVLEEWRAVSGHVLLERYGMTEIGMALSNPLHGPRRPRFVGAPLPGVDVRLVNEQGEPAADGEQGEIEVCGPSVFSEYWRRPRETAAAFRDGWFRTGDVALVEKGAYRILGRTSVDIIKTGGYKVSALEIEEVLRTHPAVSDCAVIGVDDRAWGQRVCAALVRDHRPGEAEITLDALREWAKERLASYKVPVHALVVDELPRNAMGKVSKPAVVELFDATPG